MIHKTYLTMFWGFQYEYGNDTHCTHHSLITRVIWTILPETISQHWQLSCSLVQTAMTNDVCPSLHRSAPIPY